MASSLFIVTAINFFSDGTVGYLHGPIRAMGLQKKASYVAIAVYWLFGLPLAGVFSFALGFGVYGLFGGFLAPTALQASLYFRILFRTDW